MPGLLSCARARSNANVWSPPACHVIAFAVVLFGCVFVMWPVSAGDLPRLALFDIELQDTSHEGERDGLREDQQLRLNLLNAEAKKLFENTGRYKLVDISSAAEEIEKFRPLTRCNGCDIDIAKRFEDAIAKGYGETSPLADNNTHEGRARNRRVELKIIE